jgi:hypothetical protein
MLAGFILQVDHLVVWTAGLMRYTVAFRLVIPAVALPFLLPRQ